MAANYRLAAAGLCGLFAIQLMRTGSHITAATRRRASLLKALAHPTRVLIIEALLGGELCVCHLHERAGGDVSTVSKHLALMRKAGLLLTEKRGLNNYYRLACPCLGTFLRCLDDLAKPAPSASERRAPSSSRRR